MNACADPAARLIELERLRREVEREIRRLTTVLATRKRRSRKIVPDCGTETGYQRHRYRGEDCADCKRAHALWNRARYVGRRAAA